MPYVTKNDHISALPLSVRSQHCLQSASILTIGELVDYPMDALMDIRNMGKKSIQEILSFVQQLNEGSGEYVLVEEGDDRVKHAPSLEVHQEKINPIILDAHGLVIHDDAINDLPLPVRARNSLIHNGYQSASQLLGISLKELMAMKSMGKKSALEAYTYINKLSVQYESEDLDARAIDVLNLANEMHDTYGQDKNIWLRELLAIQAKFFHEKLDELINHLYDQPFVQAALHAKILKMIADNGGEMHQSALETSLPNHLKNTHVLDNALLALERNGKIEIRDSVVYRLYPSIVDFVAQLQDERIQETLQAKLEGKTFYELADKFGVTHQRVLQIVQKAVNMIPKVKEDRYQYLFDHYEISQDDFMQAYGESKQTYNYLKLMSKSTSATRKPLDEILDDAQISPEFRKKAEQVIFKQFIYLDGALVKMTRRTLVKYFIKTHCDKLTKYDLFYQQYHEWLKTLGIEDPDRFKIESRTYENKLNKCDYVLWSQWRSFRYYNIAERDYEDLLQTLDLEQFVDTELSTLKLFRDYPELMHEYDIHDEYELHNLLKKIWPIENTNVKFKRMPTISVGQANVDDQVLSLLLQYAPIHIEDLAIHYEEVYGVKAVTARADLFGAIDQYFYKGIYSVDSKPLPKDQFDRLQVILDRDFYTIQNVKNLYQQEFPDEDESLINPYTLKTLGFHVFPGYSGYIVKNTYSGATDYFRTILTQNDFVDIKDLGSGIRNIATYHQEQFRLRAEYEIIEYLPLKFIHFRKLDEMGVTKEDLKTYCEDVARHYQPEEYFTVTSLRKEGITHVIDHLGFEEWFYSSILLEDKEDFSYQRVGKTRIFLRAQEDASLGGMLVWLLEKYKKIEINALMDLLKDQYGIYIAKDKLRIIMEGTNLYYDSIMQTVYLNMDLYFASSES